MRLLHRRPDLDDDNDVDSDICNCCESEHFKSELVPRVTQDKGGVYGGAGHFARGLAPPCRTNFNL